MLTEAQIKNARPKEKRYMLRDEHGLYLEVIPGGTKSWRFRYWIDKKEHKITIGKYPLISLKDVRERHDKLRVHIIDGDKLGGRDNNKCTWSFRFLPRRALHTRGGRSMNRPNVIALGVRDTGISPTLTDIAGRLRIIRISRSNKTIC